MRRTVNSGPVSLPRTRLIVSLRWARVRLSIDLSASSRGPAVRTLGSFASSDDNTIGSSLFLHHSTHTRRWGQAKCKLNSQQASGPGYKASESSSCRLPAHYISPEYADLKKKTKNDELFCCRNPVVLLVEG